MPPAGYYGNVNPDLLALIPPDAKTVLEIGCGEGALCEAYRRVNPGVEWKGVEINRDAVLVAESKGIAIIEYDVTEFATANNPWAECLILGDVLEHLKNPWNVLRKLTYDLKPGAQVLACIPNVQHWTVVRDLLAGKWDYQDSGLLDRTHLRFFTLKSIRELFDQAGLQVHEIIGRDICNEGFYEWADNAFGSEQTGLPKEMRAYQYIVRAIKPSCSVDVIPKLHIHAVIAEDCCARPRIHEPFAMLRTIPGVKCTTDTCKEQPDIEIQQRKRELSMTSQRWLAARGVLLIAEVDDLPEAIGMDPIALKAVHAVQCSTEALAEVCRRYNPNVVVFPNQIAELPPFHERSADPMEVNLFFGAQNRQSDWAPIMPALNRILNNTLGVTMNVVHDREFFDAIESDRKQFFPFCPYAEYRGILSMCDIALLPLEDTPFNRCKSDLKFLECAAEGVLAICGKTVYGQSFWGDRGERILATYCDPENFESLLRAFIRRGDNRRKIAEQAYTYVRDNRLLSQHYRKLYDWYQSLLSSKPALDRSLLERVPELRSQEAHTSQPALSETRP